MNAADRDLAVSKVEGFIKDAIKEEVPVLSPANTKLLREAVGTDLDQNHWTMRQVDESEKAQVNSLIVNFPNTVKFMMRLLKSLHQN